MDTVHLTYEQADALLQRAVDERGKDFVYPEEWKDDTACQYATPDGQPACIVGLALSYLGVDVTELPNNSVAALGECGFIAASSRVLDLMSFAQNEQDYGTPWGEALACAREQATR